MVDILILVGTQTGNSEALAEDLENAIRHVTGKTVSRQLMDGLEPAVFNDAKAVLLCSSTWGDGELPDNSKELYKKCVEGGAALMKDKQYANCILGDHDYDPYFCETGKIWDKVFKPVGAKKVQDDFQINKGPTDDDILGAMKWGVKFAESLG